MFWDKDLSIWQNIVVNFTLKRAIKEVLQGKSIEWKEFFRRLNVERKMR